jgi:hypothetical protein
MSEFKIVKQTMLDRILTVMSPEVLESLTVGEAYTLYKCPELKYLIEKKYGIKVEFKNDM